MAASYSSQERPHGVGNVVPRRDVPDAHVNAQAASTTRSSCLALVLDLYARKLVGWAMSETMPQELTLSALDFALGGAILMQAWCTTRTEVPRADSTDRRNTGLSNGF